MADRYFVDEPIESLDRQVMLGGAEAHHLIHVLRAKPGDEVTLFDGGGAEFPARVAKVSRSEVALDLLGREEIDRELPVQITLGAALPKGDRQRWLVEKAVELGVARIVPLKTARSVAQPVEKALARLRRTVVEASKQCGRNRLMEIDEPCEWEDFLRREASVRLLAHPGEGQTPPRVEPGQDALLAIGPEGGFTDEEVALALDAGWAQADLGRRILRIETAAVMLVAILIRQ